LRIKNMGITRLRQVGEKRWLARSRDEFPIYLEDPERLSPQERVIAVEEYRKRYAPFDT
jgi:hypothetical protein